MNAIECNTNYRLPQDDDSDCDTSSQGNKALASMLVEAAR
jgi:hypothetical protein